MNKNLKGGKFLGKGTFGCVYNPPIPCKGTDERDSTDYVSKVMTKKAASEEMVEANIIRKIDPKSNFALYGLKQCDIVSVTKSEENCLKDCTHLKKNAGKQKKGECKVKNLAQLVMKNGGYSLEYKKNKNLFKIDPLQLLRPIYDIFVGLNKIRKAGYLHRDIKNPNIVYNEGLNKFYLIDFGLMESIDNAFMWQGIHYHEYPWYPLDWHYLFTFGNMISSVVDHFPNPNKDILNENIIDLLFFIEENWNYPETGRYEDDGGPVVSYRTSEILKYKKNILKSLKKHFGKELESFFTDYIKTKEDYDNKKISKKEFKKYIEKIYENVHDISDYVVKHINKNQKTIINSWLNKKIKSASKIDSWATAKIMINILEKNKNINGSIFNNKNKKIRDFVNLLQNIGELSLEERKSLNIVLPKMKKIVDSIPNTNDNTTKPTDKLLPLPKNNVKKQAVRKPKKTNTIVFVNAKKPKKQTCGINPSSGRCKIGMPNDKKCKLNVSELGRENCAKVVKRPVGRPRKDVKPKKQTCGINPSSGRCKIGMPNDKKCKIGVTKNGGKNCAKVVKRPVGRPKKTKPVGKPKKVGRPKKNDKPKKETCGINPSSGRCKLGARNNKKCKLVIKSNRKNCTKA